MTAKATMGGRGMEDSQATYPLFVHTAADQRRWRACLHAATFTYGLQIPKDIDLLQMTARSAFDGPIPTDDLLRLGIPEPYSELRPAGSVEYPVLEEATERMLTLWPSAEVDRTRDVVQIDCHDTEGLILVVIVTPEACEFRLPSAYWDSANRMCPSSRLWKRVRHSRLSKPAIRRILEDAEREREAHSTRCRCRFCGDLVPPEFVLEVDSSVCCRCALRELGVALI
jgi:hypothetical protein